jgi:hypothetical protein
MRFVTLRRMWRVALAIGITLSVSADASVTAGGQQPDSQRTQPSGSIDQRTSGDVPANSVPQNAPCPDQAKSLTELKESFNRGRVPSPPETTGSWVAIGFFGDYYHGLNCTGLRRGDKFEQVMLANRYSIEMHVIGTFDQIRTLEPDRGNSLSFPFDFGGDAAPVYRCRLTGRKTLACLIDVYREGVEFKKMSATGDQIYSSR